MHFKLIQRSEAILINLYAHQLNKVIHIYNQFYAIRFNDTLVRVNLKILNQIKGNNWCINDTILIWLNVLHHVKTIHIQLMFHEILFIG